jgi:hypothetical protein
MYIHRQIDVSGLSREYSKPKYRWSWKLPSRRFGDFVLDSNMILCPLQNDPCVRPNVKGWGMPNILEIEPQSYARPMLVKGEIAHDLGGWVYGNPGALASDEKIAIDPVRFFGFPRMSLGGSDRVSSLAGCSIRHVNASLDIPTLPHTDKPKTDCNYHKPLGKCGQLCGINRELTRVFGEPSIGIGLVVLIIAGIVLWGGLSILYTGSMVAGLCLILLRIGIGLSDGFTSIGY